MGRRQRKIAGEIERKAFKRNGGGKEEEIEKQKREGQTEYQKRPSKGRKQRAKGTMDYLLTPIGTIKFSFVFD